MDYIEYFNFIDRPFKNTYDGKFFFRSPSAAHIFAALEDKNCPVLVHVKGPAKVGKTSILRRMPAELRANLKVVLILNPLLTLTEILRQALTDLGQSHKFDLKTREEELLGYFQNAVSEAVADGYRLLLAVDNADELTPEALSEFYGLMALEPQWRGRSVLLLCGPADKPWPIVPDILLDTLELEVGLLSEEQADQYIKFRLRAAGVSQALFSRHALKNLWELSGGSPETINQLAERSLIAAWSLGRKEVVPALVKAAKESLDNPLSINKAAFERVPCGLGRPSVRPEPRPQVRFKAAHGLLALFLLVGGILLFRSFYGQAPQPLLHDGGNEVVLLDTGEGDPDGPDQLETATPAALDQPQVGDAAPSIPTPPPQLMTLPQGTLALVVDQGVPTSRLWQGSLKGPGLKAEVATPKFKNAGLYLIGRPRANEPLIFQYPPSRDLPVEEARVLWPRVATLLPQNILPVIVTQGVDYSKPKNKEAEEAVALRVKAWVQSQQYRFPDTMASLYSQKFEFFELGQPSRTIDRDSFREALNSEAVTSGEVKLAISEPLLMLDPSRANRVWAVFTLKYISKLRNDMGLRVLIFEKSGSMLGPDSWPIVAELWLPEKSLKDW